MPSQTDRATRTDDVISDTCTSKDRHPKLSTLPGSDNTIPYFIRANSTFLTVRINWFTPRSWKKTWCILTYNNSLNVDLSLSTRTKWLNMSVSHPSATPRTNSLNNLNLNERYFEIYPEDPCIFMGNVGKYAIHGSSGYKSNLQEESLLSRNHDYSLMYRFEMLLFRVCDLCDLSACFEKTLRASGVPSVVKVLATWKHLYDSMILFLAQILSTPKHVCKVASFPPFHLHEEAGVRYSVSHLLETYVIHVHLISYKIWIQSSPFHKKTCANMCKPTSSWNHYLPTTSWKLPTSS